MSSQPLIPDLGFNSELVLDNIRFAPGQKIESLEIWKYEHQDDGVLKHERLSDDETEICNWLEEPSKKFEGHEPSAGIKFLLVPCAFDFATPRRFQVSKVALLRALQTIHIPDAFIYAVIQARVHFAQLPDIVKIDGRTLSSYYLIHSTRFGGLAWTHDPQSKLSLGIYLYHDRDIMLEVFKKGLLKYQNEIGSPHVVSLISISHLAIKVDESRKEERKLLGEIEVQTGYHEYDKQKHRENIIDRGHFFETEDFATMSAKISGSAANLARLETTLEIGQKLLAIVLGTQKPPSQNTARAGLDFVAKAIHNRAEFLFTYGDYQISDIRYLQKRVQIQLTALFNLTAQRDQNISILIAKDSRSLAISSKRDSTAMKTIAAVTMVFLPGTFVATVLALPAFQWQPHRGLAVHRQFWIYWVITIPLTLLTLLVWLLWSRWKAREELQAEQEARDDVNSKAIQVDCGSTSGRSLDMEDVGFRGRRGRMRQLWRDVKHL